MKKFLSASSEDPPQSSTLIAVHPARLREEYELGLTDQAKDEHARKLIRIYGSLSVTSLFLIAILFGSTTNILFAAIVIQTLLHLLL